MLLQGNTAVSRLMAQPSPIVQQPPAAVEQALTRLGRDIRTARLRRNWRLEDVAARMGVSRFTVADVEKGKPGTSAAAYLGALWALNNRRGDCTEQADLFVALCRARGIPARRMSGYLCDRNRRLVPALFHDWAEYYDGNRWQRVDVQQQAFETAVADHVAMRVHAGGAPADSCRFRVEGKGVKATMKDAE